MKHFLYFDCSFRNFISAAVWIVIFCCFTFFTACKDAEEPLPEGFEHVTGLRLITLDSIFLKLPGERELKIFPKYTGAFGDEINLPSYPPLRFFIDGKRTSSPPSIPTDQEGTFEVTAKIGKITSKPLQLTVMDVNPSTFISGLRVSMGDSTKAPYAIAGRSVVDFKATIFNFKGKEFSESEKPDYKFYFDGVQLENHQRVPVLRSGEIPFWIEAGDQKSEVEILHSREMPDLTHQYSLPLVFHIVHSGQEIGNRQNPSQEDYVRLLDETNDWLVGNAGSIFPKSHNQMDPNITFYMAKVGQDGNPLIEPGINRIYSEKLSYAYGDENTYKYFFDNMWNPNQYVNVFVLNIDGPGGFAFYPPGGDPTNTLTSFYGFAISKTSSPFVMIHEAGHFLGLPHTFTSGDSCGDGDRLPDTESYNDDFKQVDNYLKTNCEDEYFYATNVMDYSPSVYNSFTLDQVMKIRSTIEGGNYLPENSSPNDRVYSQPWRRGKFDPTIKPVD